MSGWGGGGEAERPPILVVTLTADPRGPTNEWMCQVGPDAGTNMLNGFSGNPVSTTDMGMVLGKIAMHGYKLQSSISFGVSSVTGHDSDLGNLAGGRRQADKPGLLVRSTTAYNNVIQHIFQREEQKAPVQQEGLHESLRDGLQQGLQANAAANAAQMGALQTRQERQDREQAEQRAERQREQAEQRAERQRLEEEVNSLRASLERERRDRLEAMEVKDRELAALRRGMMAGAGALAASIAAGNEAQGGSGQLALPRTDEVAVEEPEQEGSISEGRVGRSNSPELDEDTLASLQQQQQAELAALAAGHGHGDAHERLGSSGGPIVEADVFLEGNLWRDLGQVLAEPMPQNVYCTPMKRHQTAPPESSIGSVTNGGATGPTEAVKLRPHETRSPPKKDLAVEGSAGSPHVFLGRTLQQRPSLGPVRATGGLSQFRGKTPSSSHSVSAGHPTYSM